MALFLAAASWALLSTQPGLRLVWRFVEPRLPETMAVEKISGRLVGPMRLVGLRFEGEGLEVEVATIQVDWDILPLLRRRLDVHALEIGSVAVLLSGGAPAEDRDDELIPPSVTLPFELRLRGGVVRHITIVSETRPTPVTVDSVLVSDVSFRQTLALGELWVDAPEGRIGASGHVTLQGDYPFELESSFELAHPELGPFAGTLDASGGLALLDFFAEVSRPFGATASGSLADLLTLPMIEARVMLDETEFRVLMPDGPEGRVGGVIDVAGIADSLDASATVTVATPVVGSVELEGSAELRGDSVLVGRLHARVGTASVSAGGTLILSEHGPDMDVELAWSDVRWPIQDEATIWSDSGSGRLQGWLADFSLVADARVRSELVSGARVRLTGTGSTERMSMDELRVDVLSGELLARGSLDWVPELRWNLELAGRGIETAEILPDSSAWRSTLSFEGRTRGHLNPDLAVVDLTLDTVDGSLNSAPLQGSASGSLRLPFLDGEPDSATAGATLEWLEVAWGPNRAFVSGSVDDSIDLRGTYSLADLGVVVPTLAGSLEGWSHLRGSRALPEAEVDLEARNIVSGSTHIEQAAVAGLVETRPGGTLAIDVLATGITLGERALDTVRAGVRGAPEAHSVSARLHGAELQVDLEASGGLAERRWSGTVERLDIEGTPLGNWRLADPVTTSASTESAALQRACWRSARGRICGEGSWEAEGPTAVAISVSDLPGSALSAILPEGLSLVGVLVAEASAAIDADGNIQAEAEADFGTGRIRYPTSRGARELAYSSATLDGAIGDEGALATFATTLTDDVGRSVVAIGGNLALPDFMNIADTMRTTPLRGSVSADVDDFSPFEFLLDGVTPTGGSLRADIGVAGSVEAPELMGEARLVDGSADVPQLGLELRGVELTASGRGLEGITLEGGLQSGNGALTLSGDIPTTPSDARPARLRIRGTRVQVVALPEVQVWVSPDLEVESSPDRLRVSGQVQVPVARVELSEIPATAVRTSPDVVFVGDSSMAVRAVQSLELSVRVTLGDSLSFSGFGFSAQPTGSLLAADGPGGTTTGTGEITLNAGRYRAYGQDLTMERGRLLFAGGPIVNPGLDIRATRTAEDAVVAGLQVGGTLSRPDVTLFSEPAMAESDALAYIVLGRPLGTASASEGNRVANAAASLGLREGNVLASRIGQRFGLAEMRVAAEGPLEEAALVAGKYLSPRLYVTYGIGLFEPVSTFRLRYLLSARLTLRAESGRDTGADLLYWVERGR